MKKNIVNSKKLILSLCVFSSLLFFIGCGKKKANSVAEKATPVNVEKSSHNWYYFSADNFVKIDKPQNAPIKEFLPWTEAVRISSANSAFSSSNESTKAFGIVNRLGVLSFDGNNISLAGDKNIFSNRTAGNLLFYNNTPIYSVYKSSFFNDTIKAPEYVEDQSAHLFLIHFDDEAGISYPIVNTTSLISNPNSEVIDFVWDNSNWLCNIKTISDSKNEFSYISWTPHISLLSLAPAKAKENISISQISSDTFRKAKEQIDYSQAPERIKNMLTGFSNTLPFTLQVSTAGGGTPKVYVNKVKGSATSPDNGNTKELQGKAVLSTSWSGALFEDGTLFLEGALPGKHILRNGKPVAIRLPKLPADFIYTDFTISKTTLYAAWEESLFYKTGRSGFIQVDLDKSLYEKL